MTPTGITARGNNLKFVVQYQKMGLYPRQCLMNTTEAANPIDRDFTDTNILIVDDTPLNLGVIVEFLQSYGFGIRIARSGESALKRVQYDHPHIILLDVLMPGIDGFETCRRLKANPTTRDIPVIFMTSLTSVEDKVKGFEAGQ